jgi:hypothetical protein
MPKFKTTMQVEMYLEAGDETVADALSSRAVYAMVSSGPLDNVTIVESDTVPHDYTL